MKRKLAIFAGVATLLLAATVTNALAKDKEITIKGDAKCAMCMLHEGTACQTVIQTEKGRKTTTYYVVANDVSKGLKADVCHSVAKVTATGTVKTVDGKKELTLTKIEVTK